MMQELEPMGSSGQDGRTHYQETAALRGMEGRLKAWADAWSVAGLLARACGSCHSS